ncbi:YncE family protein [Pelomonas sp. KK5]|uniref:YncE family protein n=1 Tax=Pelomonas sp. KK5 TaxID=1855730 RepID=UPI00097BB2F7|nr:WD40 repeat domain-containing protein [Pelomonas sp. KK5]
MTTRRNTLKGIAIAAALLLGTTGFAHAEQALKPLGRTDLPGYDGDFDHFGADLKGNRLFLAGEDGGTLEVFDLRSGAHLKTVKDMETPHAIHYEPMTNRLVVSNSGDGLSKILDGRTYAVIGTIKLAPGSDVMSYDRSMDRLWFVTGGKNATKKQPTVTVRQVDASTGKPTGNPITFDTDFTEGIVAEQQGKRVFINVAGKSEVAVLDKDSGRLLATWPVKEGQNNSQIDLDEANKRLFLITRKPFKLVVLNTDTGATVASFDAPGRTNGMMFDAANQRIYAAGDDYIGVYRQIDPDHYEELARVPSEKGAKTAYLVPELNRLYVAVGGSATAKAGLLRYEVIPSKTTTATR